MTLVHYLTTHQIHVPAGTIAGYVRDGVLDVVIDEGEVSPRLLAAFGIISSTITSVLAMRNDPTDEPWCPVVIDRRPDLGSLEKIVPEVSDAGLVIPVPATLITARMAVAATLVSTELTRWVERPSWLDGEEPPPPAIARGV